MQSAFVSVSPGIPDRPLSPGDCPRTRCSRGQRSSINRQHEMTGLHA